MNVVFHPDASAEFKEAVDYYEKVQEGLGYDFSIEVYSAVKRIAENPKAWTPLDADIRRCLAKRFPYGMIYSEQKNAIFILAVMNLRREPGYWKYRI